MTSFILAPQSDTDLPISPSLSLLPIALGSSSKPYSSTEAPLSKYFKPRPCPSDIAGIETGTPIAAFRGRQVVGQTIKVPPGYNGFILRTTKPHELVSRDNIASSSKWPPTPSTSMTSTEISSEVSISEQIINDSPRRSVRRTGSISNLASVIKGKVKGAGQIAFSKPKTRQTGKKASQKRIRLDSDEEEEEEERNGFESKGTTRIENGSSKEIPRTPSKRLRPTGTTRTPQNRVRSMSKSPIPDPSLPSIVIQEATPLKEPQPTPIKRLGSRSKRQIPREGIPPSPSKCVPRTETESTLVDNDNDSITRNQDTVSDSEDASNFTRPKRPTLSRSSTEQVIPSPATENDPPIFDLPTPTSSTTEIISNIKQESNDVQFQLVSEQKNESMKVETEDLDYQDTYEGLSRILRPISTFHSFTLWTPDGPLPGFRADEELSEQSSASKLDQSSETKSNAEAKIEDSVVSGSSEEKPELEEGGIKLRKGWWRSGGAGEGGDEVVRALGEWLGLVECLNRPVYLDDAAEDSDDD